MGRVRMLAERRQMVERMRSGEAMILATLVRTEGSSYRRPGARLLLATEGSVGSCGVVGGVRSTGTISGGCLEGDLAQRAAWLTRSGPVVQHYSTAFDDTAEAPYGLGCGGELDVLLERSETAEFLALRAAMEESQAGGTRRVVTWLPTAEDPRLRRAVLDGAGKVRFASDMLGGEELQRAMHGLVEPGTLATFAEELRPPQQLVLCGAGEDARPMVAMARMLGWTVVVADGRRQLARAERFAEADAVVALERPEDIALRAEDAVVLMTHSYEQDRALLARALPVEPRYLGLLGARHRSSLLVSEVALELGWTVERCCAGLHAPVGLDLGGDGPEAIALAVIGEVQACLHGRLGSFRRLSAADVAEQIAQGGTMPYPMSQCAMSES